ncbi:hypothetical protein ACVN7B_10780 [Escherichia coli]|nr:MULTISPECIES: hypothetical protein [Enterobacteriaceae]
MSEKTEHVLRHTPQSAVELHIAINAGNGTGAAYLVNTTKAAG